MLFFALIVAAGIVALLAAEKLDIEGVNPPAPRGLSQRRSIIRDEAPAAFIAGSAFLRQP